MTNPVEFIVYGEPASKANQRRLVTNRATGKTMFIKSSKALGYEKDFALQCPQINPPIDQDCKVSMTIYYASRRPDLDESVVLDCMQSVRKKQNNKMVVTRNNVYLNDRQVKEKHIKWGLDPANPRCEIKVELL